MDTHVDKKILVGDVGSSKSSWWYMDKEPVEIQLPGYNPFMHTADHGKNLFADLASRVKVKPSKIWYYGTGVTDEQAAGWVSELIVPFFPKTSISIRSDLEGAAFATCGSQPGTVAILGTGSHAAVYDGKKIIRQAASLGYILGDEGGGCDIGKELLQAYFYKEMPGELSAEFYPLLPEGRIGFLKELKNSPYPNQYLAGFAGIAAVHRNHPWIRQLVHSRFHLFVQKHLSTLDPVQPVHVVGSIGCIFTSLIREEIEKQGWNAGVSLPNPAFRLFERHLHHE